MKKEKFFAVRQLAGRKRERVQAEGYRVERGEFVFYICGSGGSWSVVGLNLGHTAYASLLSSKDWPENHSGLTIIMFLRILIQLIRKL